jgi:hypothetical protein
LKQDFYRSTMMFRDIPQVLTIANYREKIEDIFSLSVCKYGRSSDGLLFPIYSDSCKSHHRGGSGLIPGQSMWNLRIAKWH